MNIRIFILMLAPWGFQCPDSTHEYDSDVILVREAWGEDPALPTIDNCGWPQISIEHTSCSNGCVYGVTFRNEITINDRLNDSELHAAVRHETVHWLAWCTGYQVYGDPGHADPVLWDGVLIRAEEMAQEY